jgi:hypothetical protein
MPSIARRYGVAVAVVSGPPLVATRAVRSPGARRQKKKEDRW